jgi:hypothetical protein
VREDGAVRKALVILALVSLVAGCGGGGKQTTTTATVAKPKGKPKPGRPQYVPSAHHTNRPRGFVYNDEVGENVTSATHDRIIQVFGPPASRHGGCIVYRVVRQPKAKWTFCFKGQRMVSASG